MPTYQFKCSECGKSSDLEMSFDEVKESIVLPCSCGGVDGEKTHKRVYSFGLGAVPGGGGSPGRFGSYKKKA